MRDFTTAETQRDLALVAIRQKTADIAQLDVVVTIIRTRAELHFLDFDDGLLGLGFSSLLLFLVLELAVIHQTADRRRCVGRNFHQVDIQLAGHAQRFLQRHDAQRLVVGTRQTHFRRHDFSVQSMLALFTVAPIAKFSSYGFHPWIEMATTA